MATLPIRVITITMWIALSILSASDPYLGIPLHIVLLIAHMLDLVIATFSISPRIHRRPELDGPPCAWQIGHALNVNATSNHLVPGNGFVQAGRECVRLPHTIQALAMVQWILHSTTGPCLQSGPRIAEHIGSVHDKDVAVTVAQVQRCEYDDRPV